MILFLIYIFNTGGNAKPDSLGTIYFEPPLETGRARVRRVTTSNFSLIQYSSYDFVNTYTVRSS